MKILRPIPIIRALFCLAFIACVGCDKAQVAPEFEPSGNFDINVSLSTNVITVGFLVGRTGVVSREAAEQALRATVKPRVLDLNLRAFEAGFDRAAAEAAT